MAQSTQNATAARTENGRVAPNHRDGPGRPRPREYLVTHRDMDAWRCFGFGLSLDEVIAHEVETMQSGLDVEDGLLGHEGDSWSELVIWEGETVAAVLLYRNRQILVIRLDGRAAIGPEHELPVEARPRTAPASAGTRPRSTEGGGR